MDVKVHKDYEQIDKENVEIFRKYRIGKSEEDMYRCVICGEKACISNSLSVDIRNSMFGGRFCDLVFKCVEDEKLTKKIHLYESRSNRFRITGFKSELDINSLRYVDEFDIFMMRLDRAFCNITDIMEMHDDDVEVEAEPEASWS